VRFVRFQIRNEQSWISGLELVASVLKVVVVDGLVGRFLKNVARGSLSSVVFPMLWPDGGDDKDGK
jgi:hypothetical protein